jgi:Tol biopolymer transport system component
VDLLSREVTEIPVRVRTERKIQPALRFQVDVAPREIEVKMLRWAQFSPDGKQVVFQALGYVWIKDLATGKQRRLTAQSEHFEFYPAFSRDGKQIVYTTWDDRELGSVRIVSASGGTGRTITPDAGFYVEPSFSPDG